MYRITITDTTTDATVTVEHDADAIREAVGAWLDGLDAEMDTFARALASYGPAENRPGRVSTPVAPAELGAELGLAWRWAPIPLLDLRGAAERLGVGYATIRRYRSQDGTFPEPDALLGQSPGWLPATLDRWKDSRPGQGVGGGRPRKESITVGVSPPPRG